MKTIFDNELTEILMKQQTCGCSQDAIERLRTNRQELIDSCWCYMSPPEEQCNCAFCKACLEIRNKPEYKLKGDSS